MNMSKFGEILRSLCSNDLSPLLGVGMTEAKEE